MSYNLPGDFFIFAALIFNLLAGLFFLLLARGNRSFESMAVRCYNYFTALTLLAFAYLYYLFFSHNYAIKYVYEYSDSSLPFFYLLSSFWGGQEGTYLLWLAMSAGFGYIILNRGGIYRNYGMMIMSTVNLFFLFIMLKLSPFALMEFVPADGMGLNPLLQDPWMVIHPPVIFVGYAMTAIPFAIAMAALIRNDYSRWIEKALPWAVVAAFMLAAGNILGGYWAYKTLGWGGFWAWDPVENSSFVPWFASLALLHGMLIERRSGALRKTNMLMAALCFVLVIYGTFLTRSGVLADFSVHSFVDLGINAYLVGFLVFYSVMTLGLFFYRVASSKVPEMNYNYYGREFSLFVGMLLLFGFAVVVLLWTSLPMLTSLFSDEPRAADLSTYNGFAVPFAILYALFLTVAPFTNYNDFTPTGARKKIILIALPIVLISFGLSWFLLDGNLVFATVLSLTLTGLAVFMLKEDLSRQLRWPLISFVLTLGISLLFGVRDYMFCLYFSAAAMLIVSNMVSLFGYLPGRWKLMGGQLAHFGFGIMLIGILGSSAYARSEKLSIARGAVEQVYGFDVSYQGMEHDIDYPKNRLLLTYDDGSGPKEARPQLYFSERQGGLMKKPFIMKSFMYDLYFSPEQVLELGGHSGLTLKKGQSQSIGDYKFTFQGFEMGEHLPDQSGLAIVAKVKAEYEGNVQILEVIRIMSDSPETVGGFVDFPADFGENDKYAMSISQILADQGAVVLDIPGLTGSGPRDRLILDISKKPIINLVWAGTTLILLGSLIVFYRRYTETSPA